MTGKCKDCALWDGDEGKPYCAAKPLYTFTDADRDCDEADWRGRTLFMAKTSGEEGKE